MQVSTIYTFIGKLFRAAKRGGSEAAGYGRSARTDWKIICVIFLLINLFSFFSNVFVYRQINKGEIFLVPKREPVSLHALDRRVLESTVAFFEQKKALFESLQKKPLITADPSLPHPAPKP